MGKKKSIKKDYKKSRHKKFSASALYIQALESGLINTNSTLSGDEDMWADIECDPPRPSICQASAISNRLKLGSVCARQLALVPYQNTSLRNVRSYYVPTIPKSFSTEVRRLNLFNEDRLKKKETLLFSAVSGGNFFLTRRLIQSMVNPSCQDDRGRTPLHIAISLGYTEIVQELIERGADINITDCNGNTPLHIAVISNRLSVVLKLLESGASPCLSVDGPSSSLAISPGNVPSPLHFARSRLNMLKNSFCKPDKSSVRDMVQILRILQLYIRKKNTYDNYVPDLKTLQDSQAEEIGDNIDNLCDQLETSLTIGLKSPSVTPITNLIEHSTSQTQLIVYNSAISDHSQISAAVDQINDLFDKLGIE